MLLIRDTHCASAHQRLHVAYQALTVHIRQPGEQNFRTSDMDFTSAITGSEIADVYEQVAGKLPFKRFIDIVWAAGFADGEACIHISKTQLKDRANPTYRLVVSLCQNHLGSLRRFARALDLPERIYDVKRTATMNRDVMNFVVSDKQAYHALHLLLPYLTRKAPEARMAIEAYEVGQMDVHPGPNGHHASVWKAREKYYRKLRRLK
jgi:hypothetical protein